MQKTNGITPLIISPIDTLYSGGIEPLAKKIE
jgi:hypothetical protein